MEEKGKGILFPTFLSTAVWAQQDPMPMFPLNFLVIGTNKNPPSLYFKLHWSRVFITRT